MVQWDDTHRFVLGGADGGKDTLFHGLEVRKNYQEDSRSYHQHRYGSISKDTK